MGEATQSATATAVNAASYFDYTDNGDAHFDRDHHCDKIAYGAVIFDAIGVSKPYYAPGVQPVCQYSPADTGQSTPRKNFEISAAPSLSANLKASADRAVAMMSPYLAGIPGATMNRTQVNGIGDAAILVVTSFESAGIKMKSEQLFAAFGPNAYTVGYTTTDGSDVVPLDKLKTILVDLGSH